MLLAMKAMHCHAPPITTYNTIGTNIIIITIGRTISTPMSIIIAILCSNVVTAGIDSLACACAQHLHQPKRRPKNNLSSCFAAAKHEAFF
jgi:hypothetical protein